MPELDAAQFVRGMEELGVRLAANLDADGKPIGWLRSCGRASEEEYRLLAWLDGDDADRKSNAVLDYLIETGKIYAA